MTQFKLNSTVSYHYDHESITVVTHVSNRNWPFVEKKYLKTK